MKLNELRVGNYYLGYYCISEVNLDFFNLLIKGVELDEIINDFVTLSEEWLIRFGFELSESRYDGYNLFSNKGFYILSNGTDFRHSVYGCLLDMNWGIDAFDEIKYVHELQNLYFSIKKEELIIHQ